MTIAIKTLCSSNNDGLQLYKSLKEIDRIGVKFCESYQDLRRIEDVQRYRSFRMRCLSTTLSTVDSCGLPLRAAVSVRLKRLDSIRRKINRPCTSFSLGRLDDIVGVRIVCEDLNSAKKLSDRMLASENCLRARDYIEEPAETGYRGINLVFSFDQPTDENSTIAVRFEVQVRTYLQHRWATWSESHGEAVKLGRGEQLEQDQLRVLSRSIAEWESKHPSKVPKELPEYKKDRSIVVCWRTPDGSISPYLFSADMTAATEWLEYLELSYPGNRENALLLVGVTGLTEDEWMSLIRLTHPLFSGGTGLEPSYWMPRGY